MCCGSNGFRDPTTLVDQAEAFGDIEISFVFFGMCTADTEACNSSLKASTMIVIEGKRIFVFMLGKPACRSLDLAERMMIV